GGCLRMSQRCQRLSWQLRAAPGRLVRWGVRSPTQLQRSAARRSERTTLMRRPVIRWVALLVCALLFAACGSTSSVAAGARPSPSATPVPPTATPQSAGSVSATIALPAKSNLYALAVTATAVWVHAVDAGTVMRIDPNTNKVVATIPVGRGPGE